MSEMIKLFASGFISVFQSSKKTGNGFWLYRLLNLIWNGKKVIILVILYSIANTVPLFAISRIGAPIFTVCIQLKIFTTAAFATVILGRQYSFTKWRALLLLVVGCVLVASPILKEPVIGGDSVRSGTELGLGESVLGLGAVMVQVTISGFSAVYFEALLKDKEDVTTIWERNFQLAFYSVLFLTTSYFVSNSMYTLPYNNSIASTQATYQHEVFSGWSELTLGIALLQGAGGLIVAATLKYADAVLKCFATAVSIIIVSVVGYFFLDNDIDLFVGIGMLVTVISIFNYTLDHQQNAT